MLRPKHQKSCTLPCVCQPGGQNNKSLAQRHLFGHVVRKLPRSLRNFRKPVPCPLLSSMGCLEQLSSYF